MFLLDGISYFIGICGVLVSAFCACAIIFDDPES